MAVTVTATKAIVVVVLLMCLIGVGYLTSTGSLAKAFNLQNSDAGDSSSERVNSVNGGGNPGKSAQQRDGDGSNWFDYDPRANGNGGMMLPIASRRIAIAEAGIGNGNREQRWIASAAGIKSSIGGRGSVGNNDNNAIKVGSASLILNRPSSSTAPARLNSHSHLKPTSPDPDPIATQVHEPIILSQDEKYQIINGVEESGSASEESSENEGEGEGEGNISQNHLLYDNDQHFKREQQPRELENEADENSIAGVRANGENGNEREPRKKAAGKSRKKFLSKHFPNSEPVSVSVSGDNEIDDATTAAEAPIPEMPCGHLQPYIATLVQQIRTQKQDREFFRQLILQQEQKFETYLAHLNGAAKGLTTESMRITDMESSINQQLRIMNERLEASVAKMDSTSAVSQIILQLSKESFHQMDRIQETADDVLFQVRALKTELGDVGQASVQAIYNIQRSEENLMKQLGESWNRTIYALRQEPGGSAAAAASSTTSAASVSASVAKTEQQWQTEQMQPHHDQPRNGNGNSRNRNQEHQQQQQQQRHASSSSSAPSPTFAQEEFIQADAAAQAPLPINRNDDDRTGNEALSLPAKTNDGRQDADTDADAGTNGQGESERNAAAVAANNNSLHSFQLSPNLASGSASEARGPCSSRKKLINPQKPRDCSELLLVGYTQSGLFNIYPFANSSQFVQVYCDLDATSAAGGGWTVIQRRGDYQVSRENFQRTWQDYEKGFGSPYNHFWIGLAALSSLTLSGEQILRIELTDWDGVKREANYGYFRVSNASDSYRLHVTDFMGNAGDSLTYHNQMPFTTMDADNDKEKDINCAQNYRGGWWYRNCHQANLNGLYLETRNGQTNSYGVGVNWYTWHGYYYSLKHVEMKIRNRYLEFMSN